MKKKFADTAMVCHVWAQQSQSEGEAGNVYFRGKTIYSYGQHFPLGTFITNKAGDTKVLLNSDGYSISTTRHKSYARNAVSHYERLYCDTNTIKFIADNMAYGDGKVNVKQLTARLAGNVEKVIVRQAISAGKRKKASAKNNDIQAANEAYENAAGLLAFFGGKLPAKTTALLETLRNNEKAIIQKNERQIKAAERKRIKERKEEEERRRVATLAAIDAFRAGEALNGNMRNYLTMSEAVLLRVREEKIETSRGAEFPVKHGVKAFHVIRRVKEAGERWEKNGKQVHIGHFQIDVIEPDGTVKAGCHTVPYAEIEQVARQLNLI